MKKGIILCLIALAGIACESCLPEPLEVNGIPVLTPHIVVSSQVVPGQSIAVLLTRSVSALEAGSSTNADSLLNAVVINDANVVISWQDETDTLQFLGTGIYGSASTPLIAGEAYTLRVESPSMGIVTAQTNMNARVSFDDVSASLQIEDKDTLGSVSYAFTDPPGQNWYMLNVQRYHDPENLINNLNPRIFIKAMSDADFSGNVRSETFTVPFRRFHAGDTVSVTLANISQEYYNYLKTRIDGQNSISEFVSEPVNLPTNVQGGYGYFNMQIPDTRFFEMR